MLDYNISELGNIAEASKVNLVSDTRVHDIVVHTDRIADAEHTVFAALPGQISDGHLYISIAISKGVNTFIIRDESYLDSLKLYNVILVDDVVLSLQKIAAHHRAKHELEVLAITGSNGKTVVKEWLYQLLYSMVPIVKSPKSYNSQIGVPLSLFQIDRHHKLGIFEAGISNTNEMHRHAYMIAPDIGIFTNIGDAHSAGFKDQNEKLNAKLELFADSKLIIYSRDQEDVHHAIKAYYPEKSTLSWGSSTIADIKVIEEKNKVKLEYKGKNYLIALPFADAASKQNILHCLAFMLSQGIPIDHIEEKIARLSPVEMRLEMKKGLQNSLLINDAYSADLNGFRIALDFMQKQAPNSEKLIILSKLDEAGVSETDVLDQLNQEIDKYNITSCIYLSDIDETKVHNKIIRVVKSKSTLISQLHLLDIKDKTILIKGARKAQLEEVVDRLSYNGHSTKLTINLDALEHNIRVYRSLLKEGTGMIAVIKAAAYGSGSGEVARVLSRSGVEYLAVAFVDEAISLRRKGQRMPILVFNADIMSFRDVVAYDLEIEVYSLHQLDALCQYSKEKREVIKIHLKLDSGMHRLGFTEEHLSEVIRKLSEAPNLHIQTIFSHLASSEDPSEDNYTHSQAQLYDKMFNTICQALKIEPKRHILNSSGITRFPEYQYDLVRLGLGLYGIDSGKKIGHRLRKVHTLKSILIQVKKLKAGDSIGYNRRTTLNKDTLTGVVNIGYADGLLRNLGNRKYSVLVDGIKAEIIGTVSMDLIIIDLSNVKEAYVGMEVVIFDENHPLEDLAKAADTIPYEILSRISDRVDRIYISQ